MANTFAENLKKSDPELYKRYIALNPSAAAPSPQVSADVEATLKGIQGSVAGLTQQVATEGITPSATMGPSAVAEIDSSGSPALPTNGGTVSAGASGAVSAAQTQINQISELMKTITEERAASAAEAEKAKATVADLMGKRAETLADQPTQAEMRESSLNQAYSEMGVTKEQIQQMGSLITEITSYSQQMADIEARKQAEIEKIGGQALIEGAINLQEIAVSKTYNSEIAAKAAQAGVATQHLQLLQGSYTEAKNTANEIVSALTYDQQQEVADIEWSINAYQDLYDMSSAEERAAWDRSLAASQTLLDVATKNATAITDLMLEYPSSGIKANDTIDTAVQKISNWKKANPLSVSDPNSIPDPNSEFEAGSINQAINLSLESLKFSTVSAKNDASKTIKGLLATGQIDLAKEQLNSYVRASASATQQDVLDGKQNSLKALDEVERALKEYEAAGGNTNVFTGLSEKALNKLGTTGSGKLAELQNLVAITIVDYRKAVSGAAFTESEAKAYDAIFPSAGKTSELNNAKITSLRKKFNMDIQAFTEQRIGKSKYQTIFGETVSSTEEPESGILIVTDPSGQTRFFESVEERDAFVLNYGGPEEQKEVTDFTNAPSATDVSGSPKNLLDWFTKKFK